MNTFEKFERIVVTVCTRDRPELLALCLESVLNIEIPPNCKPILVVVENGAPPRCREYVAKLAKSAQDPWDIRFTHEAELGIPFARNRSLTEALKVDADWIAFIDDDETIDTRWLVCMQAASQELDADVLQGPIEYHFLDQIPHWFDAKQPKPRPRGEKLRTAYTNNTLMRSRIARPDGLGLRFDEAMRFTGGSDSDYFYRAAD